MTDPISHTVFGWPPMAVATAIFVLSYAALIVDRLHRAIVVLVGASLVVGLGVLTQEQAIHGIDFNTIGLLIGTMVLVAIMGESGVFQFLAIKAAKAAGGNPCGLLVMLSVVTAGLSAFLNNVAVVLLVAPVTLMIARELRVSPYPLLFAEINAANTGGTATLIGDPPNIMIGSAAGLTFNQFVLHLAPLILIVFAATLVPLWWIFGRHMKVAPEAKARLMALNEYDAIIDRKLLARSVPVFVLMLVAFALAEALRLEMGTIAMGSATVLLLWVTLTWDRDKAAQAVQRYFMSVEWGTIFFFCGVFIIVAGVEQTGLLKMIAEWTLSLTGGDFALTTMAVLWVAAIMSAIVDNIPFVAAMIPTVKDMLPVFQGAGIPAHQLTGLWWALAAGACLGGNGTLIGAAANLVVAGIAERNGVPFRYLPFLKIAFPIMLLQVTISAVYVWWRYL